MNLTLFIIIWFLFAVIAYVAGMSRARTNSSRFAWAFAVLLIGASILGFEYLKTQNVQTVWVAAKGLYTGDELQISDGTQLRAERRPFKDGMVPASFDISGRKIIKESESAVSPAINSGDEIRSEHLDAVIWVPVAVNRIKAGEKISHGMVVLRPFVATAVVESDLETFEVPDGPVDETLSTAKVEALDSVTGRIVVETIEAGKQITGDDLGPPANAAAWIASKPLAAYSVLDIKDGVDGNFACKEQSNCAELAVIDGRILLVNVSQGDPIDVGKTLALPPGSSAPIYVMEVTQTIYSTLASQLRPGSPVYIFAIPNEIAAADDDPPEDGDEGLMNLLAEFPLEALVLDVVEGDDKYRVAVGVYSENDVKNLAQGHAFFDIVLVARLSD